MHLENKLHTTRSLHGFTLIEVLIALIVLSVGMLGIAGLYVHSMQAGRTSILRHNAITLTSDIADRIRANPRAGAAYTLANPGTASDCVANKVNCSRDEMAATDIFSWSQQAADTMPDGSVAVVFDSGPTPPTYAITISWTEAGEIRTYGVTIPVLGI